MNARSIIAKLRRSIEPTVEELHWFANGLADGSVSDAQAGAFAMAACLNGLGETGRVALTTGMRDSGDVLKWDLPGKIVDKHSTGGIGDCVSLVLAPMLAACDVYVPMISGRGLGHTGGTLDKLEAIPGLSTTVTPAHFRRIVKDVGCAIVGATGSVAPADKRLYAIRDVTSTVESIDLITASILSKKLAAGLEFLVLDVKVGSGAFMKSEQEAEELAKALVSTANGAGCKTMALISSMDQPLAPSIGNALEVASCMEVLSGNVAAAPRLASLATSLAVEVLVLSGWNRALAEKRISATLSDGTAMERFAHMVQLMGGPPDIAEDWRTHLPQAAVVGDVPAAGDGFISAIDGEALGLIAVELGGGRAVETDTIDPSVGLSDVIELGAKVSKYQPLATIHAADSDTAEAAALAVRNAITIGQSPEIAPLVRKEVKA